MKENRSLLIERKSELLVSLASLPDDDPRIRRAAMAIADVATTEPLSLRLYRFCEAARVTGRSRTFFWRAAKEGTIRTVRLRNGGVRLIPEAELQKLAKGTL